MRDGRRNSLFAVIDRRFTTNCPIDEHRSKGLLQYLTQRRAFLQNAEAIPFSNSPRIRQSGSPRCFPILAVLAPAGALGEGVIEYPGDPMCLYAALAVTIEQSIHARNTDWITRSPLRDVCPDWGNYPGAMYRAQVSDSGIRHWVGDADDVTDMRIFDPRVWNVQAQADFVAELQARRPRVLLLSAVSPAHRYALDIARVAKQTLSDIYVILGGRHADETMRWNWTADELDADNSSTIALKYRSGVTKDIAVDAVVSGEGGPLLDLLLNAVALAMDPESCVCYADDVPGRLQDLGSGVWITQGRGVIALLTAQKPHIFPIGGTPMSPRNIPPLYKPFGIRSRFSIFPDVVNGGYKRTAHFMTTSSCPFRCSFCSESIAVTGRTERFVRHDINDVIARVAETVHYGADALYFDDPVFWSGQWKVIHEYVDTVGQLRRLAPAELLRRLPVLGDTATARRFQALEWGAQLTVDLITGKSHRNLIREALCKMWAAGCTYIYIGIESMAQSIMNGVHKNLQYQRDEAWEQKVRNALLEINHAGMRVGTSILFGLEGETRQTISYTIESVARLIDEGLIAIASPNILTYHPGTSISRAHQKTNLDYHSLQTNRPPYIYFEEAYPGVVSDLLNEDDIWFIHEMAAQRWGSTRNRDEINNTTERYTARSGENPWS